MNRINRGEIKAVPGFKYRTWPSIISAVPILAFNFCGIAIVCFTLVGEQVRGQRLVGCLAALGGVITLQCLHWAVGVGHLSPLQRAGILSMEAALTFTPPLVFHAVWPGIGGLLAGSVLLLAESPASWFLALAVAAGSGAAGMWFAVADPGLINAARQAVVTALVGIVVFGLDRLGGEYARFRGSTERLAAIAVARERQRFARDLHDLLSYSLSVITLKSELAQRLTGTQPARAQRELEEVVRVSRQVLADVRAVAHGYHIMSLEQELESASSVMEAAGRTVTVDVSADISEDALPAEIATVLAAVLREAVTNVLSHSSGSQCRIAIAELERRFTLSVSNDGTASPARTAPGDPAGLNNLAVRMSVIGGRLDVTSGEDWFVLTARTPPVPAQQLPQMAACR